MGLPIPDLSYENDGVIDADADEAVTTHTLHIHILSYLYVCTIYSYHIIHRYVLCITIYNYVVREEAVWFDASENRDERRI
jgi:hypothetical protein